MLYLHMAAFAYSTLGADRPQTAQVLEAARAFLSCVPLHDPAANFADRMRA